MHTAAAAAKGHSRAKKYGQSCLTCRRRKVRCNGGRPSCVQCVQLGEKCTYAIHDSTVNRMQNALSKAEERIQQLEQELRNLALLDPIVCQDRLRALVESLARGSNTVDERDRTGSDLPTHNFSQESTASFHDHHERQQLSPQDNGHGMGDQDDEEGYNATSRFHVDEHDHSTSQNNHLDYDNPAEVDYHKRWLISNGRFHKSFEDAAYAGLHDNDHIDAETAKVLIKIYWTWQAPLHNCVYRRTFFRDMVLKGPYFSQFLLHVIYAHASRHIQPTDPLYPRLLQGEPFLDRARLMLVDELKRDKPAIPTIQGLLILGGRQCAVGRNSEGWLYTGMAIRMIKDLSLHLPRRLRLASTEPDELESLKRLYLSAYAWDKSISLCLGRPPSLTTMPYPTHCLLDATDDKEPWQPFYLGELESIYVPTPSYNTTTFSHFVKLSTIVNDAFKSVFGPWSRDIPFSRLRNIENKLYDFFRELPAALQINDSVASISHHPPHVCCLNILYHTMHILIYRPHFLKKEMRSGYDEALLAHAVAVCTREATAVNGIFQAYGRCFANKNQTYLLSYCVYTAATIEVKQVGDPDPAVSQSAIERLATTLAMLEEEARQTPGVRRSIEIIKMRLEKQNPSNEGSALRAASYRNRVVGSTALLQPCPPVSGDFHGHWASQNPPGWIASGIDSLGAHSAPPADHERSLENNLETLPQWVVHEDDFELWNFPTPDVGGGFVPPTMGG